jgi:hypothetical protein
MYISPLLPTHLVFSPYEKKYVDLRIYINLLFNYPYVYT